MADQVTPRPWAWREEEFLTGIATKNKRGVYRAKPGHKMQERWVYLLCGPCHNGKPEGQRDAWDYPHVMMLRWDMIRGDCLINAAPMPANREFIVRAVNAHDSLVAALRRQVENIDRWIDSGYQEAADPAESESIYDQMVAALKLAEEGGQ